MTKYDRKVQKRKEEKEKEKKEERISTAIGITSNILYFLSMRLNSSTNGEHRRFPPRQCALNRHAQQALPSILRRRDVPVPSSLFSTASPIPMEQPFSAPGLPHKRYIRTDTSYASKDVRAPRRAFQT